MRESARRRWILSGVLALIGSAGILIGSWGLFGILGGGGGSWTALIVLVNVVLLGGVMEVAALVSAITALRMTLRTRESA